MDNKMIYDIVACEDSDGSNYKYIFYAPTGMVKHKNCFVNFHCSYDCPNFQIDIVNKKYGYGIADDIGFEEINCYDCSYNSGKCNDCLFEHSKDCVLEVEVVNENN